MTTPDSRPPTPDDTRDFGFGSVMSRESRRLVNRDGSFNTVREGLRFLTSLDVYHHLLTISWPKFFGLLVAAYLTLNALFGVGYTLCGPGALSGPVGTGVAERLLNDFFFSVETLGTIGYGHIAPRSTPANVLMTLESLVSLLGVALTTGVLFARF